MYAVSLDIFIANFSPKVSLSIVNIYNLDIAHRKHFMVDGFQLPLDWLSVPTRLLLLVHAKSVLSLRTDNASERQASEVDLSPPIPR